MAERLRIRGLFLRLRPVLLQIYFRQDNTQRNTHEGTPTPKTPQKFWLLHPVSCLLLKPAPPVLRRAPTSLGLIIPCVLVLQSVFLLLLVHCLSSHPINIPSTLPTRRRRHSLSQLFRDSPPTSINIPTRRRHSLSQLFRDSSHLDSVFPPIPHKIQKFEFFLYVQGYAPLSLSLSLWHKTLFLDSLGLSLSLSLLFLGSTRESLSATRFRFFSPS